MNPTVANPGSRLSLSKRLAFSAVAVLLFLAAAEGLLRLLKFSSEDLAVWMRFNNPHRDDTFMVRDPLLFWRLRPSAGQQEINSQGLRGAERSIAKPAGTFRVLCLGDSSTFGCNVPLEQSYPHLLEQSLSERHPNRRFEVLNAGVPGYSSLQGRRALETWLRPYQPDLTIAYFGIHDMAEAVLIQDKDQRELAQGSVALDRLLERSVLYQFLAKLTRRAAGRRPGELSVEPGYLTRVAPEDFVDNHRAMRAICAEWGGKLLVMPAVSINNDGTCRVHFEQPERLASEFPTLTLCPTLDAAGALSLFDPGGVHPTPRGYALYAEQLVNWIESSGLLQRGPAAAPAVIR